MKIKKILTTLILGLLSNSAFSAHHEEVPSTNIWISQNIEFKDGQAMAFRAGLNEFMSSEMGKEMPGQVFYNWILSDGDAPATHSFAMVFPSTVAWSQWNTNFFTAAAKGNNPAAKWMQTFSASVESANTITGKVHKSWGPLGGTGPTEWIPFYTENLEAFTKDFSDYMKTSTGKNFKGSVAIHRCIACGDSAYNSGFTVNHESAESFDDWYSTGVNSSDFANWVGKAYKIAKFPGNWLMAPLDSYPAE